ncbi:putative tyrosine-protein phosphatase OCA6 [Nakaseomyces bracarensis]|uniref:Tyrosine-protein phosphatase OCA6 n=1 Tax=Nakaseomyces bracarensis TaxID=273131 RepID=A0ABR4NXR0_9SACH
MSLITPLQFSTVQPNLYRGAYPRELNCSFLRSLRLKYILSLTPDPLTDDPEMSQFCKENAIEMVHILCQDEKKKKDKSVPKVKRKKKAVPIEYSVVEQCVRFLIDKRHYPCYMHCTNGELVISLVVACLRKLSYWSTVSILNEFLAYNSSINIHERNFIENFNLEIEIDNIDLDNKVSWMTVQYLKPKSVKKEHTENETTEDKIKDSMPKIPKLTFHAI